MDQKHLHTTTASTAHITNRHPLPLSVKTTTIPVIFLIYLTISSLPASSAMSVLTSHDKFPRDSAFFRHVTPSNIGGDDVFNDDAIMENDAIITNDAIHSDALMTSFEQRGKLWRRALMSFELFLESLAEVDDAMESRDHSEGEKEVEEVKRGDRRRQIGEWLVVFGIVNARMWLNLKVM